MKKQSKFLINIKSIILPFFLVVPFFVIFISSCSTTNTNTNNTSLKIIDTALNCEPLFDIEELFDAVNYPYRAKKNNIKSDVVLNVLINAKGEIEETKIEYSDNDLYVQSVIKALKKIKITPAIEKGVPISAWVMIPLRFKLK